MAKLNASYVLRLIGSFRSDAFRDAYQPLSLFSSAHWLVGVFAHAARQILQIPPPLLQRETQRENILHRLDGEFSQLALPAKHRDFGRERIERLVQFIESGRGAARPERRPALA